MKRQRSKIFHNFLLAFRFTKRSSTNLIPRHPLNAFFVFWAKTLKVLETKDGIEPSFSELQSDALPVMLYSQKFFLRKEKK